MKAKTLTMGFILLSLGFTGAMSERAYADINSNEARVISAASGTFYYNGDYYYAPSSSLSQLHGKLDAADVDLSSSDADRYIETGYASVADAVANGYLVKNETSESSGSSDGSDTGIGDNGTGNGDTGTGDDKTGTGGTGTGNTGKEDTGAGGGGSQSGKTGTGGTGTGNTGTKDTGAGGSGSQSGKTGSGESESSSEKNSSKNTTQKNAGSADVSDGNVNTVIATTIDDPEREALLNKITGLTKGQRDAIVNDYAERYSAQLNAGNKSTGEVRKKLKTGKEAILDDGSTSIWNDIAGQDLAEGIDTEALKSRPAEKNAKSSIVFDSNDNSLSISKKNGENEKKDINELIPVKNICSMMYIISGTALLCVIICGVILYLGGCLLKERSKNMAEHRKRKSIKRVSRVVLTAASAVSMSLLATSTLGYIWAFSVSGEVETINKSGFYQYSYGTMKAKAENMLLLAGLDENILDKELDFNRFQLLSKQAVRGVLTGKSEETVPASLKGDVTSALMVQDSLSETIYTTLADEIVTAYSSSLKNSVIEYLSSLKKDIFTPVLICGIMNFISLVLAVIMFIRVEESTEKGMKMLMISTGIAALLTLVILTVNKTAGPLSGIYVSPEYLYILMKEENERLNSGFTAALVFLSVMILGEFGISKINSGTGRD